MLATVAERQPEGQEATGVWDGQSRHIWRGGERRGRSFRLGIVIHQKEVALAFHQFMRRPGR